MPSSLPAKKLAGFTLLELLVSLVLIGIILSFAVLSLGDGGQDQKIKEEANRFYHLLKLAQEESILNGREWLLEIDREGYRFSILTSEGAQPLTDPVFRSRMFSEFIKPVIQFEQDKLNLSTDDEEKNSSVAKIYILSSGELTPFQIRFPASDRSYEIKGSMQGEVAMQKLDPGA